MGLSKMSRRMWGKNYAIAKSEPPAKVEHHA